MAALLFLGMTSVKCRWRMQVNCSCITRRNLLSGVVGSRANNYYLIIFRCHPLQVLRTADFYLEKSRREFSGYLLIIESIGVNCGSTFCNPLLNRLEDVPVLLKRFLFVYKQ